MSIRRLLARTPEKQISCVLLAIVGGAALTVAIAWTAFFLTDRSVFVRGAIERAIEPPKYLLSYHPQLTWRRSERVYHSMVADRWAHTWGGVGMSIQIYRGEYGWPFRSLLQENHGGFASSLPDTFRANGLPRRFEEEAGLRSGVALNSKIRVPVVPTPLFYANAAFWTSLIIAMKMGFQFARDTRRARRGCCLECGYPVAGAARCPECGVAGLERSVPTPIDG